MSAVARRPDPADMLLRLAVAIAAIVLVTGLVAALGSLLPGSVAPPPPTRAPFGLGLREAAAPTGGIAGYLLNVQAQFYRSLTEAVRRLREGDGALVLIGLSFAYGVFHAAGPGHGKALIAAYLVADSRQWTRGFALSLAAALVQALVALALVGIVILLMQGTAVALARMTGRIETISFALLLAIGLWLTWRKAGRAVALWRSPRTAEGDACDHAHLPPPETLMRLATWRDTAGVVLAAGIRPCTGALVVLVFALAQKQVGAGIAAVFAMAFGVALTTGMIAAFAVFAKRAALALAGGRAGRTAPRVLSALELLAAATLAVLGFALFTAQSAVIPS